MKSKEYTQQYKRALKFFGISAPAMNSYLNAGRVQTGHMSVNRLIGEVMIVCMRCIEDGKKESKSKKKSNDREN
jgi:hypothetical protein